MADYQWKKKDGQTIEIQDMSDSHLENSISMLCRRSKELLRDAIKQGSKTLKLESQEHLVAKLAQLEPDDLCSVVFGDRWAGLQIERLFRDLSKKYNVRRIKNEE